MTGACFQRCVGMDALNAVFSTTYEIDARHYRNTTGVSWNSSKNGRKGLDCGRRHDRPQGQQDLAPYAQKDPDMFLRVVERRGGRHRGARRQDAPDRRPQLPS